MLNVLKTHSQRYSRMCRHLGIHLLELNLFVGLFELDFAGGRKIRGCVMYVMLFFMTGLLQAAGVAVVLFIPLEPHKSLVRLQGS